jgi:hypothetical protein
MSTSLSASSAGVIALAPSDQPDIPRGVSGSHRTWKEVQTQRSSAQGRGAARPVAKGVQHGAFRASMAVKQARQAGKALSTRLRAERDGERALKREKRLEKQRRRAENVIKGQTFTTITDSKKLKKMNKKQLRQVHKTMVDGSGRTILVPAFGSGASKAKSRKRK